MYWFHVVAAQRLYLLIILADTHLIYMQSDGKFVTLVAKPAYPH